MEYLKISLMDGAQEGRDYSTLIFKTGQVDSKRQLGVNGETGTTKNIK